MTHALYVLLAAGALGAPGDCVCPSSSTVSGQAGMNVQAVPAGNGGVLGWFRNTFGPRQPAVAAPVATSAPAGKTSIQPVVYVGVPGATVTAPRQTFLPIKPAAQGTTVAMPAPNPVIPALKVAEKYEDRVGHEKDYSWVTGHLFYIHADGGRWVVRYGLPDEIDSFGGSVVLAPGVEMRNYREGDLVCVYGDVLDAGRTSPSLGGALYRVNVISLVDRADP